MEPTGTITFDVRGLGEALRERCPGVVFALLHGSARCGVVRPGSDVDVAVYCGRPVSAELLLTMMEAVAEVVPGAECDVGVLNDADPVFRFEALRGQLLFTRDRELYLDFYSLTCREYESQMADYERQHRYRLAAHGGGNAA
jgi:predicted nucleotidyltransferase